MLEVGQKVRCIEPRMEGEVVGRIAKTRSMDDGSTQYIFEATHHEGAPVAENFNPFFGPFAEDHFEVLSE